MKKAKRSHSRRRSLKPKLKIRDKIRPIDQSIFNFEVKILPVVDVPQYEKMYYQTSFIGISEKERHRELNSFIDTVKSMIGGRYKIIIHRRRLVLSTRILLAREEDVFALVLAHPNMIVKAYRYV